MTIYQRLGVFALAVGMSSFGCAVSDDGSDGSDVTETRDRSDSVSDSVGSDNTATAAAELTGGVPTGVRCSNKAWVVDFLDDATQTTVVGTMSCTCFGPQLLAGVVSNTAVLVREHLCDFN
jgi:hypothetical protein